MLFNLCFSPVNLLLQGCLRQKPRRLEGKLVFLSYTTIATVSRGVPGPNIPRTGNTDERVMGVRGQTMGWR